MNSSHILHSQVSLSPKFHFYSTCPYFKGLAQSWVHNRHLIHNQLTGHLIPIYEHMFFYNILANGHRGQCLQNIIRIPARGSVQGRWQSGEPCTVWPLGLTCLASLHLQHSQSWSKASSFGKTVLFTTWEPREVRMWPHRFLLGNPISSHVGSDWISPEAPPHLPSISYFFHPADLNLAKRRAW